MKRLAVLALLVSLAGCGTSGSVRTVPSAVKAAAEPAPALLDGAYVYVADPKCSTVVGSVLPDLTRSLCMRTKAIEYLTREVQAGRLSPGPSFDSCTYPSDPAWPGCIEFALKAATPEIRFGVTPWYVTGAVIGTDPFTGCAAGVALGPWIRVSIADLPRSYSLVSWETANVIVFYVIDRRDLADGDVPSAATNYALAACGVE